jgi:serine-type D-Ala-D-Ala carboxypeptidase (penicillin-binding protein 5/6)
MFYYFFLISQWSLLILPYFLNAEPLKFDIRGLSAILINAESGAILFEHDSHRSLYPASTTKVAAALYALKLKGEELDMLMTAKLDSLVSLSQEAKALSNYTKPAYWLEPDAVYMGIKQGEIFTLHDLLQGMLIVSANDAANVVAQALGPSISMFMEGLNAYLKEIGCQQTYFCNPHGLHDPRHVSTAYDLALITREALKDPVFCHIVSQTRFIRPQTNKQPTTTTLLQGNRLLRPGKFHYPRAIGVKTGYHAKAQNTFIGAARSEDRTLIAVLLGYRERNAIFEDAIKLFDAAFNQLKVRRLYLKAGPQTFQQYLSKSQSPLLTYLAEDLSLDYYPTEDPQAKCLLYWRPLQLPILKDQVVGDLCLVSTQGEYLKRLPLLATKDVQWAWSYHWWIWFSSWTSLALMIGLLAIIGGMIIIRRWTKSH